MGGEGNTQTQLKGLNLWILPLLLPILNRQQRPCTLLGSDLLHKAFVLFQCLHKI